MTMVCLRVADVGDGLCCGIRGMFGDSLLVDCGSADGGQTALEGWIRVNGGTREPTALVLSQYHAWAFNGIMETARARREGLAPPEFTRLYLPIVPAFPEREEFLECVFAVNARVLGSTPESGPCDPYTTVRLANRGEFTVHALAAGDTVPFDGGEARVLWPPRVVDHTEALSEVHHVVQLFKEAAIEDRALSAMYNYVRDEKWVEQHDRFLMSNHSQGDRASASRRGDRRPGVAAPPHMQQPNSANESTGRPEPLERDFPERTRRIIQALWQTAGRIGLCLSLDNRFLFLGHIAEDEISILTHALHRGNSTHFWAMLTASCGTEWHPSLDQLKLAYAVSSNGYLSNKRLAAGYKFVADSHMATHTNGDAILCFHPCGAFGERGLRAWRPCRWTDQDVLAGRRNQEPRPGSSSRGR